MTVAPSSSDVAVLARGLVKRYGELVAVDGIDFEVRRGTCLAVLGPNGAGKTTTIEVLEGLKRPDAGEVEVLGCAWGENPRAIQERIGVQLQETEFQDKITVVELLRLFRSFYRDGVPIEEVIEITGLEEKRGARVKTLSGGQRQRLAVGCALLNRPEILFLDEPTTGLDPQARRRLWEVIETFKTGGGTVLLTTHYMEEAERLADDVIIVDKGRVIARGSPAEIIASLGAESVVEFTPTGHDGHRLTVEDLRELDGVNDARQAGASIVLSVERTQAVIARLFSLIEERGLEIEDLRTHRPTLEDVFVALTGKHLRDE
ncbi:MAG: ABC transporter ATP-binding protein [Phycisphaerales bacterium]|nr:ABC transporter ATP-binding protein [Phycisphaerae bacterium]NNM27392.1 ABC transporter ATP-binding protein [Phycisphaerales bacterium]